MVACPRCDGTEILINKEWKYRIFHVKHYYCMSCDKTFNEYYRDNELLYTIPKKIRSIDHFQECGAREPS